MAHAGESEFKGAMTRRQRHNRVLIGITIVILAVGGYSILIVRDFRAFFIACGVYTLFLLLYSLVCWLEVPKQLRRMPDRPADFRVVRLGPITANAARFLGEAHVIRDQVFGSMRHQLFRVERIYPEGAWMCEIEVADDRVLAMATSYESIESPTLDRGDQIGEGRFLIVPG
jgi:hypothetical protein